MKQKRAASGRAARHPLHFLEPPLGARRVAGAVLGVSDCVGARLNQFESGIAAVGFGHGVKLTGTS
jgi:hypothetical protein